MESLQCFLHSPWYGKGRAMRSFFEIIEEKTCAQMACVRILRTESDIWAKKKPS